MRSLLFATLLVAAPLFAQEAPPPPEIPVVPNEAQEEPEPVPELKYEPPPPVMQQDSPLVAAAKKSHRKDAKPAVVITNANLKQSGARAHVTTTAKQTTIEANTAGESKTPRVAQSSNKPRLSKKHARKAPAPPPLHSDNEYLDENDPKGENTHCPTCLPILDPVPPNLPVQQAEPSAHPPGTAQPPHDAPPASPMVAPEVTPPPS